MDEMTDKQFDKILKMVSMILDGCKDIEEAKEKVAELLEEQKKEKPNDQALGNEREGGLAAALNLKKYNMKIWTYQQLRKGRKK